MGDSVSVIIPNYNQAHYLEERLVPAFMRQSLKPVEILIIDDGSTDDSVARITALARQYPEIRLLVNESNKGVVVSVNRGVHEARGEFLSMYGCDDIPLPGYLERSVALMNRHPQAAVCVGNPLFWYEEMDEAQEYAVNWSQTDAYFAPKEAAEKLRNPMFVHPGSGLVRRERLIEIGVYDPDLEAYCDWFAWLVLIFRHGCCYIPAPFQLCSISHSSYLAQMNKDPARSLKALQTAMRKVLIGDCKDVLPHFIRSNVFSGHQDNAVKALQRDPGLWDSSNNGFLLVQRALTVWAQERLGTFPTTKVKNWHVDMGYVLDSAFPLRIRIKHMYRAIRHLANRMLPSHIRDRFRPLVHRLERRKTPAPSE